MPATAATEPGALSAGDATSDGRAGVTAVVVTHNSSVYVERCLAALSEATDLVIVVDNASTDGGPELIRSRFPAARLVELETNHGFAVACNAGARDVKTRYLLFVNPDAWPVGPAISALVAAAEDNPATGLIGPALLNDDGSPQRSVFGYPRGVASLLALAAAPRIVSALYGGRWAAGLWVRRRFDHGADGEVVVLGRRVFLSGAALLARRTAFEEAGGFDERFFFFSEEADLCFRLAERGWSIALCPGAPFVHVGGASSPASVDWRYAELLRSYLLFLAKRDGVQRTQRTHRLLVRILALRAALTPGEAGRRLERTVARLRSIELS